ncbi:MAG: GNAT family N-acetyltransferase [Acidimicrobiia bacterium]
MRTHDLNFRLLAREDFPLLATWLSQPHVSRWWRHDPSEKSVEADFGPAVDGSDPTELLLVFHGARPIGLVQSYRLGDYPEWLSSLRDFAPHHDSVGIDYLIGERDAIGHGIGSEMIRLLVQRIWSKHAKAPAVVVAVSRDNVASWRALEKAGFERVWSGVLASDDPSDRGRSFLYERARSKR